MDRSRVRGIKSSIYLSFSRLPNLMRLALRLCAANISRREEISWNASKDYWLVGRYSALLATISWGCTYYDRDYCYGRYDRTTARSTIDGNVHEIVIVIGAATALPDMMIAGMAGATIATTGVTGTAVSTVIITNKPNLPGFRRKSPSGFPLRPKNLAIHKSFHRRILSCAIVNRARLR